MAAKDLNPDAIIEWYSIAQGENAEAVAPFFRFAALWISFNAFYETEYRFGGDDLERVVTYASESRVKEVHERALALDPKYQQHVALLRRREIQIAGGFVRIDEKKSCGSLLRYIYSLRCHFFHAQVLVSSVRDQQSIEAASYVLMQLLRPMIDRETERKLRRS